ncbi:RloB domain-containing protein [Nocardia sp. SYP-A9097]|uniref:RloB family protein n=1 Tax=Nocardia sp. SYP-A9097 TaxID=2663237 RepID=UPI00129ADD63|nr:RloB family protein [Nocardia sp. SYP-A9097]MRH93014.1 RloB domain-containing protein [Nocardia sp. SYP-A9097]
MRGKKPLQQTAKSKRQERLRFLIYCEDEKAGAEYFKGVKGDLRAQIKIGSQHGEPLGLVKAAVDHMDRAERCREDRWTPYDEVWCVIDVEAPQPHACLDQALQLAKQNGVGVAFANPCFELWVMLHFESVTAHHDSSRMQAVLEGKGHCGYNARAKSIQYGSLRGKYETARMNAMNLRLDPLSDYRWNPWTDIDELVERVKKYAAGSVDGTAL